MHNMCYLNKNNQNVVIAQILKIDLKIRLGRPVPEESHGQNEDTVREGSRQGRRGGGVLEGWTPIWSAKGYDESVSVTDFKTSYRWVINRLIPAVLALFACAGLWMLGQMMERPAYDLLTKLTARPVTDSPVVLVLIDDESLGRLNGRFGPVPWPRKTYMDVFSRIAARNPALMVFDGHFVNINDPQDMQVFAGMKRFHNLITGLVMDDSSTGHRMDLNTNLPQYYRLNLGVVSMREDVDGSIRSLKPVYQVRTGLSQVGEIGIFPALSLEAAYEYLNASHPGSNWIMDVDRDARPPLLELYPENKPRQALALPMSTGDAFYLHWYRLEKTDRIEYRHSHPAIPLWKFYTDPAQAPDLTGKIALIGSSSTFYRDYHETPLSRQHLGPDIHATAIDNILHNEAVKKAGGLLNLAILAILCLLIMLLRLQTSLGKTLLYTLGTMIIYMSFAVWLLAAQGLWLDVVTPELFMVIATLVGSTFRITYKERQLALMEKNLSQLVDPEVFREIQRTSDVLKPGGHKLEITSMFVDIRNFTTLAERLQPHEVTELLNEFYSDIVNVVFAHHGTIDKFMGDGILIIFGAPLPNEQHRVLAMQAAYDILEATGNLSRRWYETKGIDTDIGISVNSGAAFVGFLGPADKLEYTGVGDTVNISVRLQEYTKQFQTRLIMSESTIQDTKEALKDRISLDAYVELGEVPVRGREGTIKIFTLKHAFLEIHPA